MTPAKESAEFAVVPPLPSAVPSSLLQEMRRLAEQAASTDSTDSSVAIEDARNILLLLSKLWGEDSHTGNACDNSRDTSAALDCNIASTSLRRFELRRVVGRGGFGIVVEATDTQLQRDVALKILRPEIAADPATRHRFMAEAQAVALLDHPGIVPVYDAGNYGPIWYIASAFCKGPSLAAWLSANSTKVSSHLAAKIVAQLADAVQHAHERGVLHRDLKPANVLLVPCLEPAHSDEFPFVPKLVDFGLAKRLDLASDLTQTGAVLGTTKYMSPEQAAGRHEDVHLTTDVYGLGAILHELLYRPARLKNVPVDLEMVCTKCLATDPADRYQSASDLSADLHRFLAGKPVLARPIARVTRFWRWCRRRPIAATTTAAAIFLVIGTAIVMTALWQRSERHLTETVVQRRAAIDSLQQSHATLVALNWALDESNFWSDSSDAFRNQLRSELSDYFQAVVHQHQSALDQPTAISAAANSFLAEKALATTDRESALRYFSASLDQWRDVLRQHPEQGAYRRAMSLTLFAATTCLMQGANPNGTSELDQGRFIEALSIDDPQDRRLLENYAELLCRRAKSYLRLNRPADGARTAKAALRIWDRLQNSHANSEVYDYWIAHARGILGDNLTRMRIAAHAEEQYTEAEKLLDSCLRRQPGDPQLILELALTLHRAANLIRRAEGPAAALPKYESAAALLQTLTIQNADNSDYRRSFADLAGDTARAYLASGDQVKAIEYFRICREASWPDYQQGKLALRSLTNLAAICQTLAELCNKHGQHQSEAASYQHAIEVLETAVPLRPEDTKLRNTLVGCYDRLAVIQQTLGDSHAAEKTRQRGLALSQSSFPAIPILE